MIEGMTEIRQTDAMQNLEKGAEQLRDQVREQATNIVRELVRRRHDIADWLMEVRKERPAVGLGFLGAFVVATGGIALLMALRSPRRPRRAAQARTARHSPRSRRR
jgi:hypothetical protein